MGKLLLQFIKFQGTYLLILFLVFVLPLALFLQFSAYQLPKVQYVFLATLFVSQYVFYSEKEYLKKIEAKIINDFKKEQGKTPSTSEIISRSLQIVRFRGVSIILTSICIFILMIYFQEF